MYTHFTHDERVKLALLMDQGKRVTQAAQALDRSRPTIYRELEKGRTDKYDRQYSVRAADNETQRRQAHANKTRTKLTTDSPLADYIEDKIQKFWSPEQIAGRLQEVDGLSVCFKTIYNYIYEMRPELTDYLRQQDRANYGTKKRAKRREQGKKDRIDERPDVADEKSWIGDWEGDTIFGDSRKKAILTHVDRKSRLIVADKLPQIRKEVVRDTVVERFREIGAEHVNTLTYDNGGEFADYELIGKAIDADIYFCHAYASWERGACEHANGLLRQFYPKGTSLNDISQPAIEESVELVNNRPRKCLDWKTPDEVFKKKV